MIAVGEWERRMPMVGRALHQLKDRKSPGGPDCQSVLIVGAILFGSIALAGSLLYAGHVVFLSTSPHLLLTWDGVALLGLLLLVGAASILARLGLPHIGGHVLAGGVLVGVVVISIWVGAMPGVVLHHLTVAAIAVALFNLRVGVIYAAASTAAFLLLTGLERASPGIPILEALPEGSITFVFSPSTALLTISLLILYSAWKVRGFTHRLTEAEAEIQTQGRQREADHEHLASMERLLAIGKVLNSTLDVEEALALILDNLKEVFPYDSASILLLSPERESLSVRAARGYAIDLAAEFPEFPLADFSTFQSLIENRRPTIIEDTQDDPRWVAPGRSGRIRSWLGIPMIARDEVIGVLSLDFAHSHAVSPDEMTTAEAFAEQAACAVQNARLYQSLAEAHEELKKADRQRAEYYSLVIHDMRSPLTVALGFIEMLLEPLQDETLAESQRFMLGQTQEAVERVLTMVNDFLDYSKIEAGYLRLEKKVIDLGELVDKTVEELRAMAASKGVNLAWKTPSPALFVQGDGRRLQQVIENLLVNAFKYTDEGGTVEVRIGPEGDQVKVEVQDTGIGIPPEMQPLLFDAYRAMAGGRLSRNMRGTGLGLFIVKRIVEAHGGSVGLHSTGVPGEGSTFYFMLPLAPEED